MKERWVFLNGIFCLASQAQISIEDRGFLFGEGIFTTLRVHQGKCELFPLHCQRLKQQTAELNIAWQGIEKQIIQELITRNQADQDTWRLKIIVTALTLLLTLQPYLCSLEPVTLAIFPQAMERPLAHLKSLAYLDSLHILQFGQRQGETDAIVANSQGVLLETGCSNIFWIEGDVCYIPDFQLPYLKGVFLQALLTVADFSIQFIQWKLEDIPLKASLYSCNALNHIRPVVRLEGKNQPRKEKWEKRLDQLTIQALQMNS
jgi:branched-subunit amino acid aminotransferase/4-amino-4-deoxychorismate lyase